MVDPLADWAAIWKIEQIEAVPVELDFSSSWGTMHSDTAVQASGVRIINAIGLVEYDPERTQVEICEECGVVHCQPGGWVVLRRIDENVVWIPAWRVMEEGRFQFGEFRPPDYMRKVGIPLFSAGAWDTIRKMHKKLPAAQDLHWIDSRETARLWQWTAPARILGEFPEVPRLRRHLLAGVADGDLEWEARAVDECLEAHFHEPCSMGLVPPGISARTIELRISLPGVPFWRGFAQVQNQICFLLGAGSVLLRRE